MGPHGTSARLAIATCFALLGACALEDAKISTVRDQEAPAYTGHIRISLAHPYDVKKQDYELLLSAPFDVKSMAVCLVKPDSACEPGSPTFFTTALTYATSKRRFFKPAASALLEDGLTLQFMSYDMAGKATDIRRVAFKKALVASVPTGVLPSGAPTAAPVATSGAVSDEQARTVIQANCGGGTCHNNYASNPSALKGTDALTRIQSGNMPKGRPMSDADKTTLATYLAP